MKQTILSKELFDDIVDSCYQGLIGTEDKGQTLFFSAFKDLSRFHHGYGTHIRNTYGLWKHDWEPEIKDGVDYSPNHPDAISMEIIEAIWERGQCDDC